MFQIVWVTEHIPALGIRLENLGLGVNARIERGRWSMPLVSRADLGDDPFGLRVDNILEGAARSRLTQPDRNACGHAESDLSPLGLMGNSRTIAAGGR